jgi:hypothetical protein
MYCYCGKNNKIIKPSSEVNTDDRLCSLCGTLRKTTAIRLANLTLNLK